MVIGPAATNLAVLIGTYPNYKSSIEITYKLPGYRHSPALHQLWLVWKCVGRVPPHPPPTLLSLLNDGTRQGAAVDVLCVYI